VCNRLPFMTMGHSGLLLSILEMKTLQRQRPSAFDVESRGLPEAAWVFSLRQMDCSPSSLAKVSLREGVQEADLRGRCSS
jgi:hypothetical protein